MEQSSAGPSVWQPGGLCFLQQWVQMANGEQVSSSGQWLGSQHSRFSLIHPQMCRYVSAAPTFVFELV